MAHQTRHSHSQKYWLSKVVYVEISSAFLFGTLLVRAGFALPLPLALAFGLGVGAERGGTAAALGATFKFLSWVVVAGCDSRSRFRAD